MEASTLSPFEYGPLAPPPVSLAGEPDERLISLVREHEIEAFEALYARYRRELLGYCRRMLGSPEDAEDVLQEVFAAAYRAMMADERPIECRPWLYRITHNRCVTEIRRRPSTYALPIEPDDGAESAATRAVHRNLTTADEFERKETFRLLVGDIQGLPRAQRTALVLREVEGRSYHQIADATRGSVGSVRSLLLRARQGLAEAVEAREMPCAEVTSKLHEAAARGVTPDALARRHVRQCERCALVSAGLKRGSRRKVAALLPLGPFLALKQFAFAKLGTLATAGCGPATGTAATVVGAGACTGTGAGFGAVLTGIGGLAVKAGIGLAVAAVAGVGAIEIQHSVVTSGHAAPPIRPVTVAPAGVPSPSASSQTRSSPTIGSKLGARHTTGPTRSSRPTNAGGVAPTSGSSTASNPGQPSPASSGAAPTTSQPTSMPDARTGTVRGRPNPYSTGLTSRTRPAPPSAAPPVEPAGSGTTVEPTSSGAAATPTGSGTATTPTGSGTVTTPTPSSTAASSGHSG